ncbi:aminopeptidase N-like [Hoplias malabaricus]|uniref:aminopeptidase N-like n=1 Tax=Hoplias malabaricus TaxID=27720 RepID=UPI003462CF79
MGKGFYVSRPVGIAVILFSVIAVVTIITLSVVYSQEKSRTYVQPTNETELWKSYRLPTSLSPLYYNVTLWPRLSVNADGLYIFTGTSGVAFTCMAETAFILIHSNKLNYTLTPDGHHAMLTGLNDFKARAITKTWLEVNTQYLVIQLSEKLEVGQNYWLYTEFQGELADDLGGFYRSEYTVDGVKRIVATTQMQPTDARKAFPCFDEPAMKAIFHMTLRHPHGTVALSNGMETGTKNFSLNSQQVLQTEFEPTKKMSTYLLAFIVSDFKSIQSLAEAKVLIRIWARRQAIEAGHGDYALNITGSILDFFQQYYNSKYPLRKSDQVALPDFSAGAMENWGLITYRETALLFDPSMSSNGDKEWVSTVISHELAHMWFGNLVTMRWWNDLWLNEGFATYASYLGVDYAQPSWNIKDLMVLKEVHQAFEVDALASSHPLSSLEKDVNTPAQINSLFDAITYSKGAAVLRMLSKFVSEPVFARGLSAYLKQYEYSNTVYTDLWGKLQEVVDSDPSVNLPATVTEIMNRWILQMGFPVVTIDTQTGSISQEHFLLEADTMQGKPSVYNYEWFVPIKWMKNGRDMGQHWLLEKTATHEPMKTNSEWVLANVNVSGFYRVNYDSINWQRLLSQLATAHSVIPELNRAQIVDDAFNLARARIINTTLALSTTRYLSEEREYMPWDSAITNLNYFFLMFDRTDVYETMQKYLRGKVRPLFNYFKNITNDWTEIPTSHTDQYNQVNAISLGCTTEVEGCTNLTTAWFRQWMENPDKNPIHPNLKSTVYCNALASGGEKEWVFAWNMYKNSSSAAEADKLMHALSCTRKPWLLNRYLEYTLDPKLIRKQDATFVIVYIANNVVGQPLAWDFIRANWSHIFEYGGGSLSFGRLILGVTKRFSTEFELKQLQQFKVENSASLGSAALAVDQAMETTKANIKWVAENRQQVMKWLGEELA